MTFVLTSARLRRSVFAGSILAMQLLATGVSAQQPANITGQHTARFLAVGNLAFVDWSKSTTAGFLYQYSLSKSRVEVMPAGNRMEVNPRWYAHMLATGGTRLRSDGVEFAAFGQLGLAHRNDSPTFTTTALVAQAIYNPRALGPAARVEIMDNIGMQAGWVFYRGGGSALFLSVDYLRDILSDLGLK